MIGDEINWKAMILAVLKRAEHENIHKIYTENQFSEGDIFYHHHGIVPESEYMLNDLIKIAKKASKEK